LADRGEDVLLLWRHYMSRLSQLYELPTPKLTNDDISALMAYDWPGNVRELQGVAERRVLAERRGGGSVRLAIEGQAAHTPFPGTLREAVAAFERELIGRAIQDERGRMDDVAASLGIGRRTLNEKIVKLFSCEPAFRFISDFFPVAHVPSQPKSGTRIWEENHENVESARCECRSCCVW